MRELLKNLDDEVRKYPAMSHPSADPTTNAVTARLIGLDVEDPARARILELGCGSGHHLLPLAARWPESQFVGVDHDGSAIALARELANEAGLANIKFVVADLAAWKSAEASFDYIIAHGVFSWVPDPVKLALLSQVRFHLAPKGIAVVSFNVAAGWTLRMPLIKKVRLIQQAGEDVELIQALQVLRDVCESDAERVIIDDMFAKGESVLAHDDFATVCDPFSLTDFVSLATHHDLRWLGESLPADNRPVGDAQVDESAFGRDVIGFQNALDEAGGRTFRSALLCRNDVAMPEKVPTSVISNFYLSMGKCRFDGDAAIQRKLVSVIPRDVPAADFIHRHGPVIASQIVADLYQGALVARTHPAAIRSDLPIHPRMDELRLACARRQLPIVDARHISCSFPDAHYEFLSKMDGTRDLEMLRKACPRELNFTPWMEHLSSRGFFL